MLVFLPRYYLIKPRPAFPAAPNHLIIHSPEKQSCNNHLIKPRPEVRSADYHLIKASREKKSGCYHLTKRSPGKMLSNYHIINPFPINQAALHDLLIDSMGHKFLPLPSRQTVDMAGCLSPYTSL